jgi:hypothetical protein
MGRSSQAPPTPSRLTVLARFSGFCYLRARESSKRSQRAEPRANKHSGAEPPRGPKGRRTLP